MTKAVYFKKIFLKITNISLECIYFIGPEICSTISIDK